MLTGRDKDSLAEVRISYQPLATKAVPVLLSDGGIWFVHSLPEVWLEDPETLEKVEALENLIPVMAGGGGAVVLKKPAAEVDRLTREVLEVDPRLRDLHANFGGECTLLFSYLQEMFFRIIREAYPGARSCRRETILELIPDPGVCKLTWSILVVAVLGLEPKSLNPNRLSDSDFSRWVQKGNAKEWLRKRAAKRKELNPNGNSRGRR